MKKRTAKVYAIQYEDGDYFSEEDGATAWPLLTYYKRRKDAVARLAEIDTDFGPRVVPLELREIS